MRTRFLFSFLVLVAVAAVLLVAAGLAAAAGPPPPPSDPGRLVGWGNNGTGRPTCPPATDFVAIAAGTSTVWP